MHPLGLERAVQCSLKRSVDLTEMLFYFKSYSYTTRTANA